LLIEFARSSPIEFDLALQPRRVFSSALRCSAPQRLELLVALLGILDFGGRDGGTNAKGQRLPGLALALAMSSGTVLTRKDEFGSVISPQTGFQ
jgi:hypothetical protein